MALNDLPASLQAIIQSGYLERRFMQALRANLGFRSIADREPFMAGIGETITKTRMGLLPAITTPMAPASVTDFTSGLSPQYENAEQYILGVAQYPGVKMLNMATARVAIDDLFLQNAYVLGEQAARSIDTLAQLALFAAYMGGNTRVATALGSPGTTIHVDDVRGFFQSWNSEGQPQPVSSSNPLSVLVGATVYTLIGVVADGAAPSAANPWMSALPFSGSSTNTSTTPGGYSGTLTFSGNVSTGDGALANGVTASVAPYVQRPATSAGNIMAPTSAQISQANDYNNGQLTMQMILNAKAYLKSNGVQPVEASGYFHLYSDPTQMTGLYRDQAFQQFFRGQDESPEYRKGVIADILGIKIIETNLNPVQVLAGVGTIRRSIICGQGALVEGVFTKTAYEGSMDKEKNGLIEIVDDIALVTRSPIDTLLQVITQAWVYTGGFVAPTDTTTTPTTIPTASNAAWKRAAVLESL